MIPAPPTTPPRGTYALIPQPNTPTRTSLTRQNNTHHELELAYACIEEARIERMLLINSTAPLLLHDHTTSNFSASSSGTGSVSATSTTAPAATTTAPLGLIPSRNFCHDTVCYDDDYENYEDDEDWVDERDVAIQTLNNRTEHLERLLLEQQQRHDQELDDLHAVVQQLQVQAASTNQQQQQQQQQQHQQQQQQQQQQHQQQQHQQQQQQQQQLQVEQPTDHCRTSSQQDEQRQAESSTQNKTIQEYQRTIRQLEDNLQEMSNKVSSHELQVVTDSSAVLSDMSLKLGEQLGENKWLKRRVVELTEAAKEDARAEGRAAALQEVCDATTAAVATAMQPQQQQQLPNMSNGNVNGALVRVTEEIETASKAGQEENDDGSACTTTPPTPNTVQQEKARAQLRCSSTKQLRDGVLRVVSDVPIDDRVELASQLRKLERMALDLLSNSNTSNRRTTSKKKMMTKKKANRIRDARRRLY